MRDLVEIIENKEQAELEELLELLNQYSIVHLQYEDEINNFECNELHIDCCVIQHWGDGIRYNFISDKEPRQAISIDRNQVISFKAHVMRTTEDAYILIFLELKNNSSLRIKIPDALSRKKASLCAREIAEYSFKKFMERAFQEKDAICDEVTIINNYDISFTAKDVNLQFTFSTFGNKLRIFNDSFELKYDRVRDISVMHGKSDNRNWMKFIVTISPFSTLEFILSQNYDEYAALFDEYKKCNYCRQWCAAISIDKNGYCKSCVEQYEIYPDESENDNEIREENVNVTEDNTVESDDDNNFSRYFDDPDYYNDYEQENYYSLEEEYNYDEDAMQSDPRYWDRFY